MLLLRPPLRPQVRLQEGGRPMHASVQLEGEIELLPGCRSLRDPAAASPPSPANPAVRRIERVFHCCFPLSIDRAA